MGKLQDLTGQKFGRLTVIRRVEDKICPSGTYKQYLCKCDCGNERIVISQNLTRGHTQSCGCLARENTSKSHSQNLEGLVFGRLTVIQKIHIDNQIKWLCQCDCGNTITATTASLKSGHTKSCGCLRKDTLSQLTYKDLTGQVFGKLTVIKREIDYISPNGQHSTQWLCKCECGNEIIARGGNLTNGHTQSCGCFASKQASEKFTHNLLGQKFGRLLVIDREYNNKESAYWKCQCDCGNTVIVGGAELSKNHTKSCGCLRSGGEYNIIQWLEKNNIEYESQKKFPNLVGINGGNLSYDFYLPTYNLLIEAQGQQHITPKELFGGEEQFQKQQEHDKRKRDYAEANGYKLLEIWYYDYDRIEEILNKELEVG